MPRDPPRRLHGEGVNFLSGSLSKPRTSLRRASSTGASRQRRSPSCPRRGLSRIASGRLPAVLQLSHGGLPLVFTSTATGASPRRSPHKTVRSVITALTSSAALAVEESNKNAVPANGTRRAKAHPHPDATFEIQPIVGERRSESAVGWRSGLQSQDKDFVTVANTPIHPATDPTGCAETVAEPPNPPPIPCDGARDAKAPSLHRDPGALAEIVGDDHSTPFDSPRIHPQQSMVSRQSSRARSTPNIWRSPVRGDQLHPKHRRIMRFLRGQQPPETDCTPSSN